MALTFDFTNYKDTSTAHVAPGTYHAEVSDFEETTSKAGNAMFVVYLEITEGPHAGQQIIDRLPQTEKAMFRSAAFLQARCQDRQEEDRPEPALADRPPGRHRRGGW